MADKRRPTLFYSWQSDHNKTRTYIEGALKVALGNVADKMDIEDAPRFDKDTQGEIGAVSITATIKRKINKSKIFVADVSLIDQSKKGRKLVNQNVIFELGYAFGKKTEKAVILIANKDLGNANELPFDIAQNRIIFCSPKTDPNSEKLIPVLEYAIRAHLGFLDEEQRTKEQTGIREQLLAAIDDPNKPTRTKSEKYFAGLYKQYLDIAPVRYKGGKIEIYGEKVVDAYQKTLSLTVELFDVVQVAAEYNDTDTLLSAWRMLGEIAAMYDFQPGETSKNDTSNDYYGLVIQEIASIIIGLLAKHERWQTIGNLIPREFIKPRNAQKKRSISSTYIYPQSIKSYYNHKTGQNYAIPTTPLIQERFVDNEEILRTYADGVLILLFALEFYYPYVAGLFLSDDTYIPEYLSELRGKVFAEKFKIALGVSSLDELRTRLDQKRQQKLSDSLAYWSQDLTQVFQSEGLLPISEVGSK